MRIIAVLSFAVFFTPIVFGQDGIWNSEKYVQGEEKLILKSSQTAGEDPDLIEIAEEVWLESARVGIGRKIPEDSHYLLGVEGILGATRVEVRAELWADDVFEEDYELRSIEEVDEFIKENKHLPEVPSESEVVGNTVDLGEMDVLLLRKVEELTLYIIEQNKRIEELERKLEAIE